MRNGLIGAAPENAKRAFSGGFAATERSFAEGKTDRETDFELFRYKRRTRAFDAL
jgi:hypothetical protein